MNSHFSKVDPYMIGPDLVRIIDEASYTDPRRLRIGWVRVHPESAGPAGHQYDVLVTAIRGLLQNIEVRLYE
jgi:hypothetical protein